MTQPKKPNELTPGTVVAGRYQIVRLLGAGAMGAVYQALDGEREIALKVMLWNDPDSRSTLSARFLREAKAGTKIASPHIVPTYDVGFDSGLGIAYISMGLLKGFDLDELMRKVGPLPPVVALRIITQAAWGVLAAHREGIIHRDLKPANIFLHHDEDGNVIVKVCDFGIAKSSETEEALTRSGTVMGSPLYMAPEQALNAKRVSERSDIFSLGVTLFAALTGRAPLADVKNVTQILISLTTKPVPSIQESGPWLPGWLASLVGGLTTLDPQRRCPSIKAMLDVLEPRCGGTLALKRAMLIGISDEQKGQRTEKVALPASWDDVGAAKVASAREDVAPLDPLLNTKLGNTYTLSRLLGRGGMGAVYEGLDGAKKYAIKVILNEEQLGEEAQRRFLREARAVMPLQSEHIIKIFAAEVDPTTKRSFFVMELLEGTDLDHIVKRLGAISPTAIARVGVEACRGLSAAHKTSIIHRDIKPANIFLAEDPSGKITCKVFDFGIAKTLDSDQTSANLTKTGGLLGSPMYMSPEQAQSAKGVDARSDIWSLCASLYEALSGVKLWGDSLGFGELVLSICTKDPLPLKLVAPWVEDGLAAVVHQGLRREPGERFASMDELAQALEPFTRGLATLHKNDLKAVTPEEKAAARQSPDYKAEAASRGIVSYPYLPVVGAQTTLSGATTEVITAPRQEGPSNIVLALMALVALALVVGGGLYAGGFFSGRSSVSVTQPRVKAQLSISPSGVSAEVNGEARNILRDSIELEGKPGDQFRVVLSKNNKKSEHTITLTTEGKAVPNKIRWEP